MTDKDREEARVIIENCHGRYNDIKKVASEVARIRSEAKDEFRKEYAENFRKSKAEWEAAVKAEALRGAAERAVHATTDYWCREIGAQTLGGYQSVVKAAILADEPTGGNG